MQPIFEPMLKLDTTFGHCDELRLEVRDANLSANVQYFRTAGTFTRSFSFEFVEAHSLYLEPMLSDTARNCVDELCEVLHSEWSARWEKRAPPGLSRFHHYAIFFTKCGLLEVLCRHVTIGAEVRGMLTT